MNPPPPPQRRRASVVFPRPPAPLTPCTFARPRRIANAYAADRPLPERPGRNSAGPPGRLSAPPPGMAAARASHLKNAFKEVEAAASAGRDQGVRLPGKDDAWPLV